MESMREVAHLFNLSLFTVHRVTKDVCSAILHISQRVIRWPGPRRQIEIARRVDETCSIPGIVGFLDGTHIRQASALGGDKYFYNRKRFPSMQLQVVADDNMMINHAYTGWPGCVHDARVLRNSSLYQQAEAGEMINNDHHIIGDSAYSLQNWLVTPFKNFGRLKPQQSRFNRKISSARQVVERTFGHIKGRFRRWKEMPLHNHEEICMLIYAVYILHNLCVLHGDDLQDYIQADEDINPNDYRNVYQNGQNGAVRRLQLLNFYLVSTLKVIIWVE